MKFLPWLTQAVRELKYPSEGDLAGLTEQLRLRFVECASETNDNATAIQNISFGRFEDTPGQPEVGLRLSGKPIPLEGILWSLESSNKIPSAVKADYPNLTEVEWQASMRFLVVLLSELSFPDE